MYKEKEFITIKTKTNKTLYDDIPSDDIGLNNYRVKSINEVSNQYICEPCDYNTPTKTEYDIHLSSKFHIEKVSEYNKKYSCDICDYNTNIKSNYDKHVSSKKHKKNYESTLNKSKIIYSCDICHYNTSIKCNYNKHLYSRAHVNKTQPQITDVLSSQKDTQLYSSIMDELKNMMLEQTTKIEEQAKIREEQQSKFNEEQTKIREEQSKMNQIITEIANKPVTTI